MSRLLSRKGVRLGLLAFAAATTGLLIAFGVLFLKASQQVEALGLRTKAPLAGLELYGVEVGAKGEMKPVLLRTLLDIRDGGDPLSDAHRREMATAEEFANSFMPDAIVASEDRRFRSHSGVDFVALPWRVTRGGGASTITMQLARTAIVQSMALPYLRKPYEWSLAAALEQNLPKDSILLHYANSIFEGEFRDSGGRGFQMHGVKTAAASLFGKNDLRELSLAESATLVALFARPNGLLRSFERGDTRQLTAYRDRVLRRMAAENGRYAPQLAQALAEPVAIRRDVPRGGVGGGSLGYFFQFLGKGKNAELLKRGFVETTVDPALQQAAAEALAGVLIPLRESMGLKLDGAVVAMDPLTGEVRALVGGVDFATSPFNRAHDARLSPGSTAKAFLYADAFERGRGKDGTPFTPASRLDTSEGSIGGWTPDDHVEGSLLPKAAIGRSSNRAAVVTGKLLGLARACEVNRLALDATPDCRGGVLLGGGANNVTAPLTMAESFSAFANGGTRMAAQFVRGGRPEARGRLFSAQAAFVTLQLMRSVTGDRPMAGATMAGGKERAGLPVEAEVAAKTGSTDTSLWAAVVHPRLVVVVAVATDDNQQIAGFGGKIAGAVWEAFVRNVPEGKRWYFEGRFVAPTGVEEHNFEAVRGCLTESGGEREFFVSGRLPHVCEQRRRGR